VVPMDSISGVEPGQIWEVQDVECPPSYLFYGLQPGDKFIIKSVVVTDLWHKNADTVIVLPSQQTLEISWRFLRIFSKLVSAED
jgi:hypothetical protein